MASKASEKISEASRRVIERTEAEFSESIIKLGSELLNATRPRSKGESVFTRGDFTAALTGDQQVIETMRLYAVGRGWINEFDHYSIPLVLKWVRLMRTVNGRKS